MVIVMTHGRGYSKLYQNRLTTKNEWLADDWPENYWKGLWSINQTAERAMSADQQSDKQLVARVQAGDSRAFDLLVLKYQHKILALISRYVRDQDEVQDVAATILCQKLS